jgi:hypothetical protein
VVEQLAISLDVHQSKHTPYPEDPELSEQYGVVRSKVLIGDCSYHINKECSLHIVEDYLRELELLFIGLCVLIGRYEVYDLY